MVRGIESFLMSGIKYCPKPKSEVLLVSSTSGVFEAIYLDSYQTSKKIFKGPIFTLDLRIDATDPQSNTISLIFNNNIIAVLPTSNSKKMRNDFFTKNSLRNRNIYQLCVNEQYLDDHRRKIMFVFMYL